jgi:hypothetical protein
MEENIQVVGEARMKTKNDLGTQKQAIGSPSAPIRRRQMTMTDPIRWRVLRNEGASCFSSATRSWTAGLTTN